MTNSKQTNDTCQCGGGRVLLRIITGYNLKKGNINKGGPKYIITYLKKESSCILFPIEKKSRDREFEWPA